MRQALVDGNNMAAAAYKVKGELRNSRGLHTGVVLTTIDMLRTYMAASPETTDIVFAWDSSPSWRKDYYPEYKANRAEKKEGDDEFDWFGQKKRLQIALAYFGIPQIEIDQMEADDIAGMWMKIDTHPITFMSNDVDWLQVLQNPLHRIYRSLDKSFVTMAEFEERSKGCRHPGEFVQMYGITGQKKDNIPGLDGIGPVTALKYLRGEMKPSKKEGDARDRIDKWMDDPEGYERSVVLSQLGAIPEKYCKGVIHETPSVFDREEVKRILIDYEAKGRLANFDDYIAPFERLNQARLQRQAGV